MTVITKPIVNKKPVKSDTEPLVEGSPNKLPEFAGKDAESQVLPEARYVALRLRARRISSTTTTCLFLTALLVLSIGIMGGIYFYRNLARSQVHKYKSWCSIPFETPETLRAMENMPLPKPHDMVFSDTELFKSLDELHKLKMSDRMIEPAHFFREEFELDLDNGLYEKIEVPRIKNTMNARFVHDFMSNKTGIVDLDNDRCFIMPLNGGHILPPKSLYDLIRKMNSGYYDINTRRIKETMRVVLPPIEDRSPEVLGDFIANECGDLPTFWLEPIRRRLHKRDAPARSSPLQFMEFAGNSIISLSISNPQDIEQFKRV